MRSTYDADRFTPNRRNTGGEPHLHDTEVLRRSAFLTAHGTGANFLNREPRYLEKVFSSRDDLLLCRQIDLATRADLERVRHSHCEGRIFFLKIINYNARKGRRAGGNAPGMLCYHYREAFAAKAARASVSTPLANGSPCRGFRAETLHMIAGFCPERAGARS